MPDIGERIETFLGEFRIIVPALGALLGFQLTVAFHTTYQDLPDYVRWLNFAAVSSTALALVCLLVPPSYHRRTAGLAETESFLRFAQRSVSLGFVFITLSIGLSLGLQAFRSFRSAEALVWVGASALAVCGVAWWLVPAMRAHAHGRDEARGGRRRQRREGD